MSKQNKKVLEAPKEEETPVIVDQTESSETSSVTPRFWIGKTLQDNECLMATEPVASESHVGRILVTSGALTIVKVGDSFAMVRFAGPISDFRPATENDVLPFADFALSNAFNNSF